MVSTRYLYSMFKHQPEALTVPEAARLLRIGKNKTYQLVNSGVIGSIRIGKKIIVPKTALIEFLTNEKYYQVVPSSQWIYPAKCDNVCVTNKVGFADGSTGRKRA